MIPDTIQRAKDMNDEIKTLQKRIDEVRKMIKNERSAFEVDVWNALLDRGYTYEDMTCYEFLKCMNVDKKAPNATYCFEFGSTSRFGSGKKLHWMYIKCKDCYIINSISEKLYVIFMKEKRIAKTVVHVHRDDEWDEEEEIWINNSSSEFRDELQFFPRSVEAELICEILNQTDDNFN